MLIGFFTNYCCVCYFKIFQNVAIGLVGEKNPFRIFDEEETGRHLALIEGEERRGGTGPVDDTPGPIQKDKPEEGEDQQDPRPAVAMDTE